MHKATFKEIQIKSEGGAGRPLGQDRLSTQIWLTAINALRWQRQHRMQHLSTESETIIGEDDLWSKACPQAYDGRPKYKDLDEFRYSGAYEITYYESRELGV